MSSFHHVRRLRARHRACASSAVGLRCSRTICDRSTGATPGARAAQSASVVSSASCTTDPSCSALNAPSCAAAARCGSPASERAVSTVWRTVRDDTPSWAAMHSSIAPRRSSTATTASSSTCRRRCSRTSSSRRARSRWVSQHSSSCRRSRRSKVTRSSKHGGVTLIRRIRVLPPDFSEIDQSLSSALPSHALTRRLASGSPWQTRAPRCSSTAATILPVCGIASRNEPRHEMTVPLPSGPGERSMSAR